MRSMLLAPVLATFALSTIQPADACGPYGRSPRLLQISSHYVDGATRTFVLTNEGVPERDLAWVRLAPMTYDYASLADAPDPTRAIDFTLIGPSGTRVVSSREKVYLSHTFLARKPAVAMEISASKSRFSIAMAGKHADASWIELGTERRGQLADLEWVKARGMTPLLPEHVSVSKLAGTDLEMVRVLPKSGELTTFVRRGNDVDAQFEGTALGGVTTGGQRFVIASKHGEAPTAIWL
jgi:hypothetical protein